MTTTNGGAMEKQKHTPEIELSEAGKELMGDFGLSYEKLKADRAELLEACKAVLQSLESAQKQRSYNAPMLRRAIKMAEGGR